MYTVVVHDVIDHLGGRLQQRLALLAVGDQIVDNTGSLTRQADNQVLRVAALAMDGAIEGFAGDTVAHRQITGGIPNLNIFIRSPTDRKMIGDNMMHAPAAIRDFQSVAVAAVGTRWIVADPYPNVLNQDIVGLYVDGSASDGNSGGRRRLPGDGQIRLTGHHV